jgi:hypothetical protein
VDSIREPNYVSEQRRPSLRREALRWAMANRGEDGNLPSGRAIAEQFGRHERWGRLVKQHGEDGQASARMHGSAE